MQAQTIKVVGSDTADFGSLFETLLELRTATRALYDLFPDRGAVNPLHRYIESALDNIRDELVKADSSLR